MQRSEIVIICVWYNPNSNIVNAWKNIAFEICDLIIVDNSSVSNYDKLKITSKYHKEITYIALLENKGIAFAQNRGIDKAIELGYKYIIFFDQDSNVDYSLINGLYTDFIELNLKTDFLAAIGPVIYNQDTNKAYKTKEERKEISDKYLPTDTLISSGTTTSIEVLKKVGNMNEKLFIDLVDHEWCWRAKNYGYSLYINTERVMYHKVGVKEYKILNFPIILSSPIRYYYKYRNAIWLFSYKYVPLSWKLKTIVRKVAELFVVPLITSEKIKTLKYIYKGIKDGLKQI